MTVAWAADWKSHGSRLYASGAPCDHGHSRRVAMDDDTPMVVARDEPGEPLQRTYEVAVRLAEVVQKELRVKIERALGAIDDGSLFRCAWEPHRTKSLSSLKRKAAQQQWSLEEALEKSEDLLGLRLVCSNLQDARRVADRLVGSLAAEGFDVKRREIDRLKKDGYRAIHLLLAYPIRLGADARDVRTEIQIRSMLQHAWADLSRREVYATGVDVPETIRRQMRNLATLLSRADRVADSIRNRLSRPRRGRRIRAGGPLTAPALGYLYEQAFGEPPSEYLVQSLLSEVSGASIRADGLEALLSDREFLERLREAKAEAQGDATYPAELMHWCLHAMTHDTASAIALARRHGRDVARSEAAWARGELLSGLPDGIDGFLSDLEDGEKDGDIDSDIQTWASAVGALERCGFCATPIVDAETFAQEIVRHYRIRGDRAERLAQRIQAFVENCGVETGGPFGSSTTCSYCDYKLGKDD